MQNSIETIKVNIEGKELECKKGISLLELSQLYENKRPLKILAAKVNNKVKDIAVQQTVPPLAKEPK